MDRDGERLGIVPDDFVFLDAGAHRYWRWVKPPPAPNGNFVLTEVQGYSDFAPVIREAQIPSTVADALLAASSNNTNAVATLDTPFANDQPTLADLAVMRAKLNEMLLAMRR